MYQPSKEDSLKHITVFHFRQAKKDFKAVVAFDGRNWTVDVFFKEPTMVDQEIYVKLDNYCLSHSVEWMAIEYATRIRKEELETP